MVAIKGNEAERLIAAPPKGASFFLIYGPDAGLVSERIAALTARFTDPNDPFSLIKLDAAAVAGSPTLLADEAYAVSMFGGRRAIIIRDSGSKSSISERIMPLMESPPPQTVLILEGGDLKPSHALRALFERDKAAYAVPCYMDDTAALAALVEAEMKAHGLVLQPEARSLLLSLLGGDRLLSRGEVRKLCLFALGKGRVEAEDVAAIVGDASAIAVDDVIDAAACGDLQGLGLALARADADGMDPDYMAQMMLRHMQALDKAAAAMSEGTALPEAVEQMQPKVFFKRKAKIQQALKLWTPSRLQRAMDLLAGTLRDVRLNPALGRHILGDALLRIAAAVAPARKI